MYNEADRYQNYTEISARFNSEGGCGHKITKGDRIGWNRRCKKTQCATCWDRWSIENQQADFDERQYASQY